MQRISQEEFEALMKRTNATVRFSFDTTTPSNLESLASFVKNEVGMRLPKHLTDLFTDDQLFVQILN